MNSLFVALILISCYAVLITALWWTQRLAQKNTQPTLSNKKIGATIANTGSDYKKFDTHIPKELEKASTTMLETAEEARRLHQTFQKFVPRQFVDHFAKGGADSLALGFADEDEVAVMFCDIRGFTSLSEQMTTQELMNFLNAYFKRMNAPIHENNGFIDKFIGDAIMALFDHPNGTAADKATDSINAALDLQTALKLYNHHRSNSGYDHVKNGIGLHIGPVILGTVGSDDRMDTTVLGDAVNIAQRIESLTNYFGLDILASRSVIKCASQKTHFAHRSVDKVRLKGKSTSIDIVEIIEHLDEQQRELRLSSESVIQHGITLRKQGQFDAAISHFKQAQLVHLNDPVFNHHIITCERLKHETNWDGSIQL